MGNQNLSQWRLKKAQSCLDTAQILVDNNLYEHSINRSYYAIFHAMRTVLALENFETKKHSGVIARFHLNYIKTGNFDKRLAKIIDRTFRIRNRSDYEDFYIAEKSEVAEQLANAKDFVAAVAAYIQQLP
ncbi:MAG: HEPN domain-containing protein [Firmicutes bacterium]|nr:HEPN domain-containing protein [Bacillota bacterium]